MPKNCGECDFLGYDDNGEHICDITQKAVEDDCPLIELPPHGRLIDEEDMTLVMFEAKHSAEYEGKFIITEDEIYALPTIIESEEEDG